MRSRCKLQSGSQSPQLVKSYHSSKDPAQPKELNNVLKSRDIILPTKVCLVKAMVFPVVLYGCESWTIKKVGAKELMVLNCGVGEDS